MLLLEFEVIDGLCRCVISECY